MENNTSTCAVIGAGIAGIAAAIRLANKGYKVTVFEANNYTGGKLTQIEKAGFRFDAGPSLFTMPHFVEELFQLSGKDTKQYFQYEKLDTVCHYFYEDGTVIRAYADKEKFAEEVAQKTVEDKETILHFLEKSAKKYALTANLFLFSSLHKVGTYLSKETLKGVLGLPTLGVFKTMNRANEQTFKDERVTQLFNRFATYNGSNPYETPATLNIIPHLEHNIGAFMPKGGMYSISQSLYKLAQDIGVRFVLNSPVEEIVVEKG
ncbi:MAG: NAD(P)/FAD-dependent oxidoreductase, partial [Bacteroidota bacterium]